MSAIDPQGPAPSRLKYRMERLWLTPVYRSLIRTGLPVVIVLVVLGSYLKNPETQARMAISVANARSMIEERPEFAVKLMRIQGASDGVAAQIREALPMEFPISSLRMNLPELKEKIELVDAVQTADIFLRSGILDVEITEREPALVWRTAGQLDLLDAKGIRAGVITTRDTRADLPLVVGEGAADYAEEALQIIKAIGPLADRFRGLQRIGARRWDIVLDRGQKIQLPSDNPVPALDRLIALHRARDVLARDVLLVDLRNARRPTIRLSQEAVTELRRLRKIADEGEEKL